MKDIVKIVTFLLYDAQGEVLKKHLFKFLDQLPVLQASKRFS